MIIDMVGHLDHRFDGELCAQVESYDIHVQHVTPLVDCA